MDPYEEEQVALEKAAFAAELRMAMEEGVEKGWLFVEVTRKRGESLRLDRGRQTGNGAWRIGLNLIA